MYGVQKQQLRNLSKQEFLALKTMCHLAKNMYNVGLYNVRQHYFATKQYLSYVKNNQVSKPNENYQLLNTDVAQQLLKKVDEGFKSFFALVKKEGQKAQIPRYLKKDSYFELTFPRVSVKEDGTYILPMSPAFKRLYGVIKLTFPTNLDPSTLSEIRIQPKVDGQYFEIEYVYKLQVESKPVNANNAMILDLGLNNLASVVTTNGASFILDGKPLKAKNHLYNKQNAKLQSIKDRQGIKVLTNRQYQLLISRQNFVNDYLNKAARYLVNHCLENDIGTMIVGYNRGWKTNINLGRRNNQNFVQIPHGKFKLKLAALCKRHGIVLLEQEESYTSKASFLDRDPIPTYNPDKKERHTFSGRRTKRGLYRSKDGILVNADINGSCNILVKSGFSFNRTTIEQTCKQNPKKICLLPKKKVSVDPQGRACTGHLTVPMRRQRKADSTGFDLEISSKNHVTSVV